MFYLDDALVQAPVEEGTNAPFLPNIVRLSISAFRAEDPGSNPGRSTMFIFLFLRKKDRYTQLKYTNQKYKYPIRTNIKLTIKDYLKIDLLDLDFNFRYFMCI